MLKLLAEIFLVARRDGSSSRSSKTWFRTEVVRSKKEIVNRPRPCCATCPWRVLPIPCVAADGSGDVCTWSRWKWGRLRRQSQQLPRWKHRPCFWDRALPASSRRVRTAGRCLAWSIVRPNLPWTLLKIQRCQFHLNFHSKSNVLSLSWKSSTDSVMTSDHGEPLRRPRP